MRLTSPDDFHFRAIKSISDQSFSGIEVPTEDILRYQFERSALFVQSPTPGRSSRT